MRRYRKPQKFRDPGKIELLYQRLERSPFWKFTRTVVFPALIIYGVYDQTWGHAVRREAILSAIVDIQHSAEHLPQFMLSGIEVRGLPDRLDQQVEEQANIEFPISIFHVDQELLQEQISNIKEIESFAIDPQGGGNLVINATQANPVAIWKNDGKYKLITKSGRTVAGVFHPGEEPGLPLVAGDGANKAAGEIPFLLNISSALRDRMEGLIRVGERRWDIMMKNGTLIMLPEQDPVGALQQVMSWEEGHSITSRRISRIDMRIPREPSFRVVSEEDAFLYSTSQY